MVWDDGRASQTCRTGNAADKQLQLDVFGEIADVLWLGLRAGMMPRDEAWALLRVLLTSLEERWREPDEGIWEVRGPRRHFTHSKVMAWVAFDRAVKAAEHLGLDGPVARWRAHRAEQALRGRPPTEHAFREAAEAELAGAEPLRDNRYKVPLVRNLIVCTLSELVDAS